MPELPEVETVRRGLRPVLEGARVRHVLTRRPDLRFPLPDDFKARLEGATVTALERRAKYLVAGLDTGETLVMHLGMTGRFEVEAGGALLRPGVFALPAATGEKHAHVVIDTEAGARITYSDPRRFGFMGLVPTDRLGEHPWFAGMGPEPLGPHFDAASLGEALKGRSQAIKTLLLDQRIVAGLGNIYVCEALHRARIHPEREAGKVSRAALTRLVPEIRAVLNEAIAAGGSTLRDYARPDGELGYFAKDWRVYGREGDACACGGRVERIAQGGRSSFFCAKCQK